MKIVAIALVLIVGIGLIAFPFIKAHLEEAKAAKFLSMVENGTTEIEQPSNIFSKIKETENISDKDKLSQGDISGIVNIDDVDTSNIGNNLKILGKIVIPKIDVTEVLVEGAGDESIKYAVGLLQGSANIGTVGNSVVFGHRQHIKEKFFTKVDELEKGDEVKIILHNQATYVYTVDRIIITEPSEDYFGARGEGTYTLTLNTCHPRGIATHRLQVECTLVQMVLPDGSLITFN